MIHVHDLRHADPDAVDAWLATFAAEMRKSDREEMKAMQHGLSPEDTLTVSVAASSHAFVVTDRDGKACAIFGAAPHPLPGVGVVWMLGTDGIHREAHSIARRTRRYFDELNAAYSVLWNWIDARNRPSMRWLRWGGFKVVGETPMGSAGLPFHIFARTNLV